ncbi:unnamed protein product [Angiostrongylus costaricensis]|uniref:GLOBIN domain-containing protein n=1 Tax=Angiostrongylus costaricensis TaxID=334426 RepID=A0A0R3PVG6_ANGCS|nr:unnamed protein product [Angiostrongylus costaricensis]
MLKEYPIFQKRRSGSVSMENSASTSLLPQSAPLSATRSSTLLTVPDSPIRKRSGSAPALKVTTLATLWNLRKEQVRALRMTWTRLCEPPRSNCKGIVNLVERVWEKLDRKDSSVRNIFYNAAFVETMHDRCERRRSKGSIATLRDHTHFFVSLVSQVIQSLDLNPENILNHVDTLGRNHAYLRQYGFRSQHWEKIGEYFVDIVVIQVSYFQPSPFASYLHPCSSFLSCRSKELLYLEQQPLNRAVNVPLNRTTINSSLWFSLTCTSYSTHLFCLYAV